MVKRPQSQLLAYSITAVSFFILGLFVYARFFETPYIGFYFNPTDGEILRLWENPAGDQALRLGDRLLQVGRVTFQEYRRDLRRPLFETGRAGENVPIRLRRGPQELTIAWVLPGPNRAEVLDRLHFIWLPYAFWLAGTATLLLVYPRDRRWGLLVAFNYLTAFWLMAGLLSAGRAWHSSILMRMAIWLCLPVYLHLHWVFPRPLGRLPAFTGWGVYGVGLVLALAQWFQLLPSQAYLLGYLLAILGSAVLLAAHAIRHPEQRRDLSLLALAFAIVILPVIAIAITGLSGRFPWYGMIGVLTLPFIPGAYFFAIYRRQLGGLELRLNRAISLALYAVLLFVILIALISLASARITDFGQWIVLASTLALLAGLASALFYPRFERFVERRLLRMPLPPARLLETYSTRIITSLDLERLVTLLRDELLPSLLVRQALLLRLDNPDHLSPVFSLNITASELPRPAEIPALISQAGAMRLPQNEPAALSPWVRLVLPLKVEGNLVGLMLFGRRDPDDLYAASEIPTLQALMDQTALALQNISQAEQLRAFYHADIEREEAERSRLARDLHDSVLGQLALLAQHSGHLMESEPLLNAYQAVVGQIRDIIHGLRPTMLAYGLRSALLELIDDMLAQIGEGSRAGISIAADISPTEVRYPPEVELHLFRIAQQACQNALKHAQARHIRLEAILEQGSVELLVTDDGVGFEAGGQLDLVWLLANKHYGLAGMFERAKLIGAHLEITSTPENGAHVHVLWREK